MSVALNVCGVVQLQNTNRLRLLDLFCGADEAHVEVRRFHLTLQCLCS